MSSNDDAVNIGRVIEWVFSHWLGFTLMGLFGAAIGFLFSCLKHPLYQAEAVLGVNINYGITEPLELIVEDRALNRVAAVIQADDTLREVLDQLPETVRKDRSWDNPADLRESIRIDQNFAEWGLVVIDTDAEVAVEVAEIWSNASLRSLDEVSAHAWRAFALLGSRIDVLCEHLRTEEGVSIGWSCQSAPLELDPEVLAGVLQNEITLSRGVLPNLSYDLLQAPSLPTHPVVWGRGTLILAGGLLGLLGGCVLMMLDIGKKAQAL